MRGFQGKTLSWELLNGAVEVALHREPCNEIGPQTLEELERLVEELGAIDAESPDAPSAVIIYSKQSPGFSAGADLRELYFRSQELSGNAKLSGVRSFLERIHAVLNRLDAVPLV